MLDPWPTQFDRSNRAQESYRGNSLIRLQEIARQFIDFIHLLIHQQTFWYGYANQLQLIGIA